MATARLDQDLVEVALRTFYAHVYAGLLQKTYPENTGSWSQSVAGLNLLFSTQQKNLSIDVVEPTSKVKILELRGTIKSDGTCRFTELSTKISISPRQHKKAARSPQEYTLAELRTLAKGSKVAGWYRIYDRQKLFELLVAKGIVRGGSSS